MSDSFLTFAKDIEPIADAICKIGLAILGIYLIVTFSVMFCRERRTKNAKRNR